MIVGGGFGGLAAAHALAKAEAEVALFDRHNHHLFQPLLYQVATAALSPGNIAAPIRKILSRQKNCDVIMAEVTDVDVDARTVTVIDQPYAYDYLILAAGACTEYFGNDRWSAAAPGLKTISEAIDVRCRFLLAFEQAEIETDEAARRAALTFAIVGAGPTGVEMAGAMAEISRQTLRADFRHLDTSTVRIMPPTACFPPSLRSSRSALAATWNRSASSCFSAPRWSTWTTQGWRSRARKAGEGSTRRKSSGPPAYAAFRSVNSLAARSIGADGSS